MGGASDNVCAVNDLDLVKTAKGNICVTAEVHNRVQQDICITIGIALGV